VCRNRSSVAIVAPNTTSAIPATGGRCQNIAANKIANPKPIAQGAHQPAHRSGENFSTKSITAIHRSHETMTPV
jgi:hypothetical protein